MSITALRLQPVDRITGSFRLLMMVLLALGIALTIQASGQPLLILGVSYLLLTTLLWLLGSCNRWDWTIYPLLLADTGAITAFIRLAPTTTLPLWTLYLLPLSSTALAGRRSVSVAAFMSLAGYLIATWPADRTLEASQLWPTAILLAAAFVITTLTTRWLSEYAETRAWREISAAARALLLHDGPEDVASVLVARIRRLTHAERAWLWWCDADGLLQLGPQAGPPLEQALELDRLTPTLAERLSRRPLSITELGEPLTKLDGSAFLLEENGARVALLGVAWRHPPPNQAALQARLRLLAPWAVAALAQAQARSDTRERLRREQVLRRAATDLAATENRQTVREAVVAAAQAGVQAMVTVREESWEQVLATEGCDASSLIPLGSKCTLIVDVQDSRDNESDLAWLEQLASLARAALARCSAHAKLEQDVRQLHGTFEALPAPAALWDANGRRLLANVAYRALDHNHLLSAQLPPAAGTEDEIAVGSPCRTFVRTSVPVPENQGVLQHYREITREREALKAKDELISMVGHELRTPLTSIYGYSQLMGRQIEVVQRQVNRLNRLIGDFFEASRTDDGHLSVAREPVDLATLARAAADRLQSAQPARSVRLDLVEVPKIEGDPVRLDQVLDNLLTNAAKYSPPDSEILLTIRPRDGQVLVAVRDQGIGIEAENLPQIFDRFYRVKNSDTHDVAGFGLGLSIVQEIVKAHGGRVWAESKGQGKGATFWVSLPLTATFADEASEDKPAVTR